MQPTIFSKELAVNVHKKHDKKELGLFKEAFRCAEMLCLCSKTYCCYDKQTKSTSSAAEDSIKEHWKSVAKVDQCQNIAEP